MVTQYDVAITPLTDAEMAAIGGSSWLSHLVHQVPVPIRLFPLGPMLGGYWSGGKFTFPRIQPILN
jgi:hypothetical protein